MTELNNQELIRAISTILADLHLKPTEELHFSNWQIKPWQKILIAGKQTEEGKTIMVRLKIRTPGEVNPRQRFIRSESVARYINDRLAEAGLPVYPHSLGHAVGLNIHEAPRLTVQKEALLQPYMAVTIEPGVYVEGAYGIRIEDLVLLTDSGIEVLSHSPKEMITL